MIKLIDTTQTISYKSVEDCAIEIKNLQKQFDEKIILQTEYDSKLQKIENEKTIYTISALNSHEMQLVNDATVITKTNGVNGNVDIKTALRARLLVQFGLKGWTNAGEEFKTESRTVLGIKKDFIAEELLNKIPINIINELGDQVQTLSVFTESDRKN